MVVALVRPSESAGGKLLAMAAVLLIPPTIGALAGLPVVALTPLAPLGILGAVAISAGVALRAALARVARDSEAGATAVLDADAVEPLVNALALYMDLPQLRAEVLNAFSALTCTPRGRAMISAGNGLQRLAAAMKMDAGSEACHWGCSTFANLACGTGEQKRAIATVGAVAAICAAMEAQRHQFHTHQAHPLRLS